MDPNSLYDILLEKASGMTGSFNIVELTRELSRKILELSKRSRNDVIEVNKTIYVLMIIHSERTGVPIPNDQPVLGGRSFDGNRGVTYIINFESQIDEILMKVLYLYVSNITSS